VLYPCIAENNDVIKVHSRAFFQTPLASLMNSNRSLVVLGDPVAAGVGGISRVLAGSGDGVLDSDVIDT
jgi:hypothetical protein